MMRPRTVRNFRKSAASGFVLLAIGIYTLNLYLAVIGLVVFAGSVLFLNSRGESGRQVRRIGRRSNWHDGTASTTDLLRTASPRVIRRKAHILAPYGHDDIRDIATPLGRAGRFGPRIWSSVEHHTARIGGPRVGKTAELACRIIDAPGAVIATSTKPDLWELTADIRAERTAAHGGRVYVFNPSGMGGLPSTITFDPLDGCQLPVVARHRAQDLIAGSEPLGDRHTSGDRGFWNKQAARVLAMLMHAASLDENCTMADVQLWLQPEAADRAVQLLQRSPYRSTAADAIQFLTTNINTRTSITTTIADALGWLTSDPALAAAGMATGFGVTVTDAGVNVPDRAKLDVGRLLFEHSTIYLLGDDDTATGPLITAFTGQMARAAKSIAAMTPGGRLSPALTLVLDEAARICGIPLPYWTADFGGRNITVHLAAQSRAQLIERWGHHGAAALLNNIATILLFGGMRDDDDLRAWVELIGERDEAVPHYNEQHHFSGASTRRVPVISKADLAQLPEGQAVAIRTGHRPAIVNVEMAWQRGDLRAASRFRSQSGAGNQPDWSPVTETTSTTLRVDSSPRAGSSSPDLTIKGADASLRDGHSATLDSEPPPDR